MALGHKTNKTNLCLLLSAATASFVFLPDCQAALPPATLGADEIEIAEARAKAIEADPTFSSRIVDFAMQPIRSGGTLSYVLGYDSAEGKSSRQQGMGATLNVQTGLKGYIWHPAISNFAGSLGLSMHRQNNSSSGADDSSSKGISIIGNAKLSVLEYTRFPFEMHIDRTDTRNSSNFSAEDAYTSQRFGFSQRYTDSKLSGSLSWDRSTQFNEKYGGSRQDSLQLSITPVLSSTQSMQLAGSSARSFQEVTGERTKQENVTVQHSYTPSPEISVSSSVNLSRSGYRLAEGENDANFAQLSSLVFWRPKDTALTMTGGVRLFALASDGGNQETAGSNFTFRSRNTNFNVGANYEFSKHTRLTASGNLNLVDTNGTQSTSSNEQLGITYNPDPILFGKYVYNWSTSASGSNSAGGNVDSIRQLSLQLSHGLSRSFDLNGSALGTNVTQGISSQYSSTSEIVTRIDHTGALSLGLGQSVLLSLTVSDSRTLGSADFLQMVNFQATGNVSTGPYSSWSSNITVQSTRQKSANPFPASNSEAGGNPNFVTTSSGSISYQNQRAFNVPRLQFTSNLRLNSQGLLPVLSGPDEHISSSWDANFSYAIGRTQLMLSSRVSKSSGKMNKSIMFTATRAYGNS